MRTFIGVVHLPPLPGSPRGGEGLQDATERALQDAVALRDGGVDGLILENFGDAPFSAGRVDAATVASMTTIALRVRDVCPDLQFGINVLRNDPIAALAIAQAVNAEFIRVNIHTGAMVTDQGLIQGDARGTLLERRRLGSQTRIASDILVKHAVPLGDPTLEDVARDTAHRGLADVLIVTGSGTGRPHDPARVARVKAAVPHLPVWVGSGITLDTASHLKADGAIVGTALHVDGDIVKPIDRARVESMREAL